MIVVRLLIVALLIRGSGARAGLAVHRQPQVPRPYRPGAALRFALVVGLITALVYVVERLVLR